MTDEFNWSAAEAELPAPVVMGDDDARHTLLGILSAAQLIGIRKEVWEAVASTVPKFEAMFEHTATHGLPDPDTLEWLRMEDLVIDAVPVAETWLRGWLRDHGVPYLSAPVMCPSHGMFMYLIAGDPDRIAKDFGPDTIEGLNLIMGLPGN